MLKISRRPDWGKSDWEGIAAEAIALPDRRREFALVIA